MQIIIPMTGYGSRFVQAGYTLLKPFIIVHGKPIIEWVVSMFDEPSDRFTFICRKQHLDSLPYMWSELQRIAPDAQIVAIDNWVKKGPVYDVLQVEYAICDDTPVLISYCDYYMQWNYASFKQAAEQNDCAGAVPCYSGFHPHLIPKKNLYASCKTDANDMLIEIREKFSYTADKTQSRHSPGVYYFKDGVTLKEYYQRMLGDPTRAINGEYYSSLPYNYMIQDDLSVWAPVNVDTFCQWGTPEDLSHYLFWTNLVAHACNIHIPQGHTL